MSQNLSRPKAEIKTEDQGQDQDCKPLFEDEKDFTEAELSGVDDEKPNETKKGDRGMD